MMANATLQPGPPPTAVEFLKNISSVYLGLTIVCAALTLITIGIFIDQLLFIFRFLFTWRLRFHVTFVLSIYSVYSLLSMVTMFLPRAIPINNMVSGLYISIGLYVFVRLLIGNYGGTTNMLNQLVGKTVALHTPPICCCCLFLPTITLSKKLIFAMEGAVLQYSVIRPIMAYIQAVAFADQQEDFDMSAVFSRGMLLVISTLVAMYGLQLLFRVSIEPLSHVPLKAKFRCLQIVLLIDNMQGSLFTSLGTEGVIPGADGLTAQINSYRIHRMLTVVEMLLLAVVARVYYRRYMNRFLLNCGSAPFSRTASTRSTAIILVNDEVAEVHRDAARAVPVQALTTYPSGGATDGDWEKCGKDTEAALPQQTTSGVGGLSAANEQNKAQNNELTLSMESKELNEVASNP